MHKGEGHVVGFFSPTYSRFFKTPCSCPRLVQGSPFFFFFLFFFSFLLLSRLELGKVEQSWGYGR